MQSQIFQEVFFIEKTWMKNAELIVKMELNIIGEIFYHSNMNS